MVGLALAAALSTNPLTAKLRLALLDRQPPQDTLARPLPGVPDLRVSTLTPASLELLARCGAWQHLAGPRSAPFADMQVWDSGR